MDKDLKTVIRRWLTRAEEDLRIAKIVLDQDPPITNAACFHSQQCVEKALKAFLVHEDQHVKKTHNLEILVQLCTSVDKDFEVFLDYAAILTDYAVTSRYPDDWCEIPVEEAQEAIEKAEEVITFVRKKLEGYL